MNDYGVDQGKQKMFICIFILSIILTIRQQVVQQVSKVRLNGAVFNNSVTKGSTPRGADGAQFELMSLAVYKQINQIKMNDLMILNSLNYRRDQFIRLLEKSHSEQNKQPQSQAQKKNQKDDTYLRLPNQKQAIQKLDIRTNKNQNKVLQQKDLSLLCDMDRKNQQQQQQYCYYMSLLHLYNRDRVSHLKPQINENESPYYYDNDQYFAQQFRSHFKQNYSAIQLCKQLQKLSNKELQPKIINLPQLDENLYRGTLVFDMDETLMHCNESLDMESDHIFSLQYSGLYYKISFTIRPYVREILKLLSKHFEIIVFTASQQPYADQVLDFIDGQKQWIKHRFYRESCIQYSNGALVKDLRVFGNRNFKKLLLIDNAAHSFQFQLNNGVPILPYINNRNDKELIYLYDFLMELNDDFPSILKKTFGMKLYWEGMSETETLIMLFQDR